VYEIHVGGVARRDLDRLPNHVFDRIAPHVNALAENPRPRGCRKMEGSLRDWRLRIGDYRIIYEIDDDARRVIVLRVKHRREAYR